MASYATPAEVATALGITAPSQLVVDRACREVDQALLTAVYDVDASGVATATDTKAAIKAAVIEQIAGNRAAGDTTGLGNRSGGGFTIGRLAVQAPTAGDPAAPAKVGALWRQAWLCLQQAGLLGEAPASW
jgi:hypothetical protein